jgi:CBS domain-containing protein
MSSPVKTIKPSFSSSEVLIKMIRSKTHHLVVTEDGTDQSRAIGMISDHDIMIAHNNHPSALIKRLRKEEDPSKWSSIRNQAEDIVKDYLEKELSVELVSNFITEINDTLIDKAIEYALEKVPEAKGVEFAWLSLGSEGREEQLLRTDQDNAILFKGNGNSASHQKIILEVAQVVNSILAESGFEECPAGIMAKNPMYCQSLAVWKKYFRKWIQSPDPQSVMNATIFFDFRKVYGSDKLVQELQHFLIDEIGNEHIFLNHLAANALQNPPPLSFFKKFLVEKSGEHIDQFDIKKRAMMPLSDIARVLILQYRILDIQNTSERYLKLGKIDLKNKELYDEAAQAYRMMIRIRAKYGLKNSDSGRFIDIEDMNKLEKQILRSAFTPIKELQEMMETRFQLAYFR